jgi:hypothetical protein
VASTVTSSGGVASSGEMQRPLAYGHETRSAFPHESRKASLDNKRQSVHAALENYGLNSPVPAPPSPMRSKSALGRDLLQGVPRPVLFPGQAVQVVSPFDHDAELFETPADTEYRYVNLEEASPGDLQSGSIRKSHNQVHDLGDTFKSDANKRIGCFDSCGEL